MNRTTLRIILAPIALLIAASTAPAAQETPARAPQASTPPAAPKSSPFLWRVEGHGATAYLYGTIHLPDDRVLSLPETVERAFSESDAFYAEIEATAASQTQVQRAALLEPGVSLDQFVDAATWKRIDARLAAKGVNAPTRAAIKRMEPWAISALLPTLDYFEDQMRGKAPLDKDLYERAAKEGKTVGGLETVAEQLAVFGAFTREEHARMLVDSLDQLDAYEAKGRDLIEEMISAWRSGADAKLMELLDDGFGTDPAVRARMERQLLWNRNQLLADRMAMKIKAAPATTTFFAVGALHLPDPRRPEGLEGPALQEFATKKGLVTLLRERGFQLTRVAAPVKAAAGER
ncbi:MAG: TraB/GumN family protein [Planctomycetota bacterium]|nr:TraB/GumN family protein [Planctomycetota bacterium]